MVDEEGAWFTSSSPPTFGETSFVEQVRALGPDVLHGFVSPADTHAHKFGSDFPDLLSVDIPHLLIRKRPVTLQVLRRGHILEGCWADDYLWDDRLGSAQELKVPDIADDREAARVAVRWLGEQLARPLGHEVWTRGVVTVAERWFFMDTGNTLDQRGRREVLLRPASSTARIRP